MADVDIELESTCKGRSTQYSQSTRKSKSNFYQFKQNGYSDYILQATNDESSLSVFKIIQKAAYCIDQNKWESAILLCDKGLNIQQDPQLYNMKGRALGKLGFLEQKVQLTKKAIEMNPNCAAYYRNLGSAQYKLHKYQQSFQSHKKSIQLQPNNSINFHNAGSVLYRLDKYKQAIQYFIKAIQCNRYKAHSYRWLGNCYKKVGEFENALECFQRAYDLSEKDIDKFQLHKIQRIIHPWRIFFNRFLFC